MEMNQANINAVKFFKESKTVWTSENFQNIFLSKYVYTEGRKRNQSIDSADLQKIPVGTNPETLVFPDANEFLEQLALLIKRQMNGEAGELLNDSSANYFFIRGNDGLYYSILVRWEPAQKLWRCGAYLQENLKMPSLRIFYPKS